MANEHIGRLQKVGLAKETTPGTGVAPTVWVPQMSIDFKPVSEKALDNSAYGVIDEVYDSQTVKNMTEMTLQGIIRDINLGLLLYAAMGSTTVTVRCTLAGIAGGTPAIGDSVSIVSPAMTGTIKYIANNYYYIEVLTGAFNASSNTQSMTDGTWTGTVGGVDNAIFTHIFERLNTNNHPSLTVTASDPVDPIRSAYAMVDSLEIEASNNNFATFSSVLKGKKLEAGSGAATYAADNPFLGKFASVKFAAATSGLDAAVASELSRFKLNINKNVTDYQKLGSDDVNSLHNQQFNISGDLDALYNSETFRDYMLDSTKRACRLSMINTDVTIGSAGNPELLIDMARQSFRDWGSSSDNNGLRTQSMGFDGEFSVSDAFTLIILLTNTQSTAYSA